MGSEPEDYVSRSKVISVLKKSLGSLNAPGGRYLTVDNLHQVLQPFGLSEDEGFIDLIRAAHLTADGKISFREFDKVLQKQIESLDEPVDECVRNAFDLLDYDKNGYITIPELFHLFGEVGEMWTDSELFEVVKAGDIDGDGRLDLEDFFKFLGYKLDVDDQEDKTDDSPSHWPPVIEKIQQEKLSGNAGFGVDNASERPSSASLITVLQEAEDAGLLQYSSQSPQPVERQRTEDEIPRLLSVSPYGTNFRRGRSNSLVPPPRTQLISPKSPPRLRPRSSSVVAGLLRNPEQSTAPRSRRQSLECNALSSLLLVQKLEGALKENTSRGSHYGSRSLSSSRRSSLESKVSAECDERKIRGQSTVVNDIPNITIQLPDKITAEGVIKDKDAIPSAGSLVGIQASKYPENSRSSFSFTENVDMAEKQHNINEKSEDSNFNDSKLSPENENEASNVCNLPTIGSLGTTTLEVLEPFVAGYTESHLPPNRVNLNASRGSNEINSHQQESNPEKSVKEEGTSNSIVENKYLCDPTNECKSVSDSTIEYKRVKDSVVENKDASESTVENRTVSESTVENRAVSESTIENRTISESTVENRAVSESTVENRAVIKSTVENVTVSESTVVENRTVSESTVENRTVSESTVENRTVSESTVENMKVSDSSVENMKVNGSTVENTTVSESTVENRKVNGSTVENMTVSEPTVENMTVSDSSVENRTVSESTIENRTVSEPTVKINKLAKILPENMSATKSKKVPPVLVEYKEADQSPVEPKNVGPALVEPKKVNQAIAIHKKVDQTLVNPKKVNQERFEPKKVNQERFEPKKVNQERFEPKKVNPASTEHKDASRGPAKVLSQNKNAKKVTTEYHTANETVTQNNNSSENKKVAKPSVKIINVDETLVESKASKTSIRNKNMSKTSPRNGNLHEIKGLSRKLFLKTINKKPTDSKTVRKTLVDNKNVSPRKSERTNVSEENQNTNTWTKSYKDGKSSKCPPSERSQMADTSVQRVHNGGAVLLHKHDVNGVAHNNISDSNDQALKKHTDNETTLTKKEFSHKENGKENVGGSELSDVDYWDVHRSKETGIVASIVETTTTYQLDPDELPINEQRTKAYARSTSTSVESLSALISDAEDGWGSHDHEKWYSAKDCSSLKSDSLPSHRSSELLTGNIRDNKFDIKHFAKQIDEALKMKIQLAEVMDMDGRIHNKENQTDRPDRYRLWSETPPESKSRLCESSPDSGFAEQNFNSIIHTIDNKLKQHKVDVSEKMEASISAPSLIPQRSLHKQLNKTRNSCPRRLGVLPYRSPPPSTNLYHKTPQGRCVGLGLLFGGLSVLRVQPTTNKVMKKTKIVSDVVIPKVHQGVKHTKPGRNHVQMAQKNLTLSLQHQRSRDTLLRHQSLSRSLAENKSHSRFEMHNRPRTRNRTIHQSIIRLDIPDGVSTKQKPIKSSLLSTLPVEKSKFYC